MKIFRGSKEIVWSEFVPRRKKDLKMVIATICRVIGGINFSNIYIGSANIFKHEHFAGFKLFARFIKRFDIIARALWNNDSTVEQTGFSFLV